MNNRYVKRSVTYEVMQYNGDVNEIIKFGIDVSDEQYKQKHVAIKIKGEGVLVAVGNYIVKGSDGEIEILSPEDFDKKYMAAP